MNFPLTSIHPSARIAKGVSIDPFTSIAADVQIGEGTWIGSNVTIFDGARIGANCKIFPGAVIAAIPQDLKYKGENTFAIIGDNSTIRECVTVNKGTSAAGKTQVGKNCLLMAYVHIAHDCIIADNVILANSVNLAGHVEIDEYAILEGYVGVSQFIRIGAHSFIGGQTGVRKDVPPFVKAAREPLSYTGINSVGLRRRGYETSAIQEIQDIYRIIYQSGMVVSNALTQIEDQFTPSEHRDQILQFIRASEKGIMRGFNTISAEQD